MTKLSVRPGYACINLSLGEGFKTFRLKTVENKEEEKITSVIWHNMRLFKEIILDNLQNNIYVYRLSSDLIPFCTLPYMRELYKEKVEQNDEMQSIYDLIDTLRQKYDLRISIHPSQFNVLSSTKKDVVMRSIEEINTQTSWIQRVGGKNVVLHMGGIYGDKQGAIKRLEENLQYVDCSLLSIENDDKSYHVEDVVTLCEKKHLKWVYDFHHDRCYSTPNNNVRDYIMAYPPDKYHLSTGTPEINSRPHADYISKVDYKNFTDFLTTCGITKADVIFEAKKKNLAIHEILNLLKDGYWCLKV